ncbi:MAG TPA: SET domain-containing protein-lysine N-methyltransferase [Casimicrobiaceae bacterium]|nr:SET domain-containing protein-lysine N-methyltransferase [Casimicrobiaceae bacterium]
MPAKTKPYAVRHSAIHGRGVFATRTIRKGAEIIEYRGQRTTWEVGSERQGQDPADPYHTFLFELDDGRVIDASVRGNAARWINHSCDPNCEAVEDDDGRVFIHARRTIRAGDELAYDYRLHIDGRITNAMREAYACRCGARRCRGSLLDLRKKKR